MIDDPAIDPPATDSLSLSFPEPDLAVLAGAYRRSPRIGRLAMALAKAQGVMEPAAKDTANPYFRTTYADFASVREASRKPLSDNGLAFCQLPRVELNGPAPEFQTVKSRQGEDRVVVKALATVYLTTLLMCGEEFIENELYAVIPSADPQSIGSAITYLKRYSLAPMVGVAAAEEDDDGEAAAASGTGRPDEAAQPEFVKSVRAIAPQEPGGKPWHVVATTRREYVTDDVELAKAAEGLRARHVPVEATSERKQTAKGVRNQLLELAAVPAKA